MRTFFSGAAAASLCLFAAVLHLLWLDDHFFFAGASFCFFAAAAALSHSTAQVTKHDATSHRNIHFTASHQKTNHTTCQHEREEENPSRLTDDKLHLFAPSRWKGVTFPLLPDSRRWVWIARTLRWTVLLDGNHLASVDTGKSGVPHLRSFRTTGDSRGYDPR